MALTISSPAFENGAEIPKRYTCDGEDVSPELRFGGVPQGAKGLALIVHDPDAPDPKAPRMDWVHWILYNLPPTTTVLREGVGAGDLPPGTLPPVKARILLHLLLTTAASRADVNRPCKTEPAHITGIDLLQRTVPRLAGCETVGQPFFAGLAGTS